jgi:hypothetical protein
MPNIITPIGYLSFPSIFAPSGAKGETDEKKFKYSANIVWPPKSDPKEAAAQAAGIKALNDAAKEVAREKWQDKGEGIYAKQKHQQFKTIDDEEDAKKIGFPIGSIYLGCKANLDAQPGVVGRYAGKDGKPVQITDPKELYAGCQVRFSVRPYAYDNTFGKGVSFGLNNVQKMGEGERKDGRRNAADEFEAEEAPPADDLLG